MTENDKIRLQQLNENYTTLFRIVDTLPEDEWDTEIAKALPDMDKLAIQLALQAHFATVE